VPRYYYRTVPVAAADDDDDSDVDEPHWSTQPFVLLAILLAAVFIGYMLRR
jgi:hypothetical protein